MMFEVQVAWVGGVISHARQIGQTSVEIVLVANKYIFRIRGHAKNLSYIHAPKFGDEV